MKFKLSIVVVLLLCGVSLFPSPRIISDNRIENMNGFPTLGRGYSMTSNRLQSMCFKSVKKSKPTFDLNYDIEEVTDDFLRKLLVSDKNRIQNTRLNTFIKKYYDDEEISGNEKYTLKNLIVKVEVNQYYYSMDETHSKLSDSARELLRNKQYITFFNSCGHFYVRSVGTFSTYYALLQYRLTGKGDDEFRSNLEKGLFNFYEESRQKSVPKAEKRKDKKIFQAESSKLTEDARYRGLKVYVQGIGLSTGDPVNLIPVNIKQFRKTVQEAVKLMQAPDSGLVNSIEVVPWMENPEFGIILMRDTKEGGRQFIRQQRIEENTGVITEIYRKSKDQLELYNVSSMCRRIIVDQYADKSSGGLYRSLFGQGLKPQDRKKEFTLFDRQIIKRLVDRKIRKYDGNKTLFYNLQNENDKRGYISLNDYIKYFHGNPPERFLRINRHYLYGDKGKGALDCINRLYEKIDEANYRNIPSCVRALRDVELNSTFINQYCLPRPVKVVYEGEEKNVKQKTSKEEASEKRGFGDVREGQGKIESFEDIKKGKEGENSEEQKLPEQGEKKEEIRSFEDIQDK